LDYKPVSGLAIVVERESMEKESNFGRKGERGRKQKEGGGSGIDRGKRKR
jgi:hypothetical protein